MERRRVGEPTVQDALATVGWKGEERVNTWKTDEVRRGRADGLRVGQQTVEGRSTSHGQVER